jgi:hypothetical protein
MDLDNLPNGDQNFKLITLAKFDNLNDFDRGKYFTDLVIYLNTQMYRMPNARVTNDIQELINQENTLNIEEYKHTEIGLYYIYRQSETLWNVFRINLNNYIEYFHPTILNS